MGLYLTERQRHCIFKWSHSQDCSFQKGTITILGIELSSTASINEWAILCRIPRGFGMTEKPVMSETAWNKVIPWVGKYVEQLALATCEQIRSKVTERGDKLIWVVSFDGFYITHGHHSNNCSATLHDVSTDKIAWFMHQTKQGPSAYWQGTSGGAEGDMLREILESVKGKGFNIKQLIMDHDTSGSNIAVDSFPEVQVSYCGNHSAKSFHNDLTKLKAVKCKVLNRRPF